MRKTLVLVSFLAGCVSADDDVSAIGQAQMADNQMADNALAVLGANPLTANPTHLANLVSNPLASASFQDGPGDVANPRFPYVFRIPRQTGIPPVSWEAMKYLVSCALPAGATVRYTDPYFGTIAVWQGALGLAPEWATGVPSSDSRQLVTACLLARQNAEGIKNLILLKGNPEHLFETSWEKPGVPLAKVGLISMTPGAGPGQNQNWGWTPAAKGTCNAGESLNVSMASCGAPMMARVCTGTTICFATERIGTSANACTTPATFMCPAAGVYNVMTAPATAGTVPSGALIPSKGDYVLWSETDVVRPFARAKSGQPIASTVACTGPSDGVTSSCGWIADSVGRCDAGESVLVQMSVKSGDPMLRVCDGYRACDSAQALAQDDDSGGNLSPLVSFTCPASQLFSIQRRAFSPAATAPGRVVALNATIRLREDSLFPWREGAFFGDLFTVAPGVNVTSDVTGTVRGVRFSGGVPIYSGGTPAVLYPNSFSCIDGGYTNEEAIAKDRLCAGLAHQACVSRYVGVCADVCSQDVPEYETECVGNDVTHYVPITTYLADPCDVVTDPTACARGL